MSHLRQTFELDPLQRKQFQQCLPSSVPVIIAIANKSRTEGKVPKALVRPLPKKSSLD